MSLKDRNAIVTGASRGIGKATAIALARAGANVYVVDIRLELLEKTAEECRAQGVDAQAAAVDVCDSPAVEKFVDELADRVEHIDVLVNNAGITRDTLILRMSDAQWNDVLNTNLKGVFNFTRAVAKHMLRNRSGSIINISSSSGLRGNAGQANYAAAKAGIIGFSKSAAREFGSRGIRVNAVAPGFVMTDMTDVLPDKIKDRVRSEIPLKRFAQPEEIASAIVFLAGDDASYITGVVLQTDGGLAI